MARFFGALGADAATGGSEDGAGLRFAALAGFFGVAGAVADSAGAVFALDALGAPLVCRFFSDIGGETGVLGKV